MIGVLPRGSWKSSPSGQLKVATEIFVSENKSQIIHYLFLPKWFLKFVPRSFSLPEYRISITSRLFAGNEDSFRGKSRKIKSVFKLRRQNGG